MNEEKDFEPLQVKVRRGESGERLIKRFLKKIKKDGIMKELSERRFYKKPSELRQEKEKKKKEVLRKLKIERDKKYK